MQVSLDGKPVKTFEVKEREDERRDFVVKLKPGKGVHKISVAYLNNYVNNDSPDPALRGDRNLFIKSTTIIGPLDAPQPKLPAAQVGDFCTVVLIQLRTAAVHLYPPSILRFRQCCGQIEDRKSIGKA